MYTRHPILFEDRWLIAINKPVGVLSHPNPGVRAPSSVSFKTLRTAFEGRYHFEERQFDTPGGPIWLIHRLDQDTSGVLLASKDAPTAQKCRDYFEGQQIRKFYLALVIGKPHPSSGIWRDHLQKRSGRGMVRSVILRNRPPNAELRYTTQNVESTSALGIPPTLLKNLSFLQITLITGRTHQIRVQSAARRHPVAGDRIYGDFQLNRELRSKIGLNRLFLHAWRLEFHHPVTGHSLNLEAPLPEALEECLERLKK